jgi:pimeloyl-ACP methyl ester carboxylesterase
MLEATVVPLAQGRVRVARLGSGPPLVLLHGYPDNLQLFCELAPRLAAHFEVTAFDWPGMGESDRWPGGTTPDHMAERLRALLDHWGIEAAIVAGMDMGGQPALAFAARHPERTRALVAMNCLALEGEKTSWEIRLLRRYRWNEPILRLLPRVVFARAERTFLPAGVRLSPQLRAELWRSFRRREVRAFISRMCGGYQGSLLRLPELYARIACPTLVLWGERDRHFPLVQGRGLHAAIPGSRLEIVPGGEHWMVWHAASEVAHRILAFLADALSPGAPPASASTGRA